MLLVVLLAPSVALAAFRFALVRDVRTLHQSPCVVPALPNVLICSTLRKDLLCAAAHSALEGIFVQGQVCPSTKPQLQEPLGGLSYT